MLRKNRTQTILRITRYVRKPGLEIHKVITGAPLSTWTSPTTESGSTVKSWNKSKKMRSPVPCRGLKPRRTSSTTPNQLINSMDSPWSRHEDSEATVDRHVFELPYWSFHSALDFVSSTTPGQVKCCPDALAWLVSHANLFSLTVVTSCTTAFGVTKTRVTKILVVTCSF